MEIVSPVSRLRDIRKYFDLNQIQFCELLGISRQNYLSRYENNEHEFGDSLKLKLVSVFQEKYDKRISLDWLITGNGDMFIESKEALAIDNERNLAISDYKKALEEHIQSLEKHLVCAEQVYKVLEGHGFTSSK